MSDSYSLAVSQQMMTLSAIAYALDGDKTLGKPYPVSEIKSAIETLLKDQHYATGGLWSLAWGPERHDETENLAFVAHNSQTNSYAVVVRGTSPQVISWLQDAPTGQVPFTLGGIPIGLQPKVSTQFNKDAVAITAMQDSGQTIAQYLQVQSNGAGNMTVYVTGHSQGGGLTPMVLAYVAMASTSWQNTGARVVQGYSYAGPTSGNKDFAKYADEQMTLFRVVNPNDIVPFGYAALDAIVIDQVPTTVPKCCADIIDWLQKAVNAIGSWQQPTARVERLTKKADPSGGYWTDQVEYQHSHNTYLSLLNAPPVTLPT